jgi:predicted phosphoribosyltransferase
LTHDADEVVCAAAPVPFLAVGHWYEHFDQTSDEEVQAILAHASPRHAA